MTPQQKLRARISQRRSSGIGVWCHLACFIEASGSLIVSFVSTVGDISKWAAFDQPTHLNHCTAILSTRSVYFITFIVLQISTIQLEISP